jgi:AAA15 family ATPase/GTPase
MALNSLHIKNFRAFTDFEVKKLGRINLIVGKNNSGKSSVLEAIRIYAGNANRTLLNSIMTSHDEASRFDESKPNDSLNGLPCEHFFSGRVFPSDDTGAILIGESLKSRGLLKINHVFFAETDEEVIGDDGENYTRTRKKILSKATAPNRIDSEVKQGIAVTKNKLTRLLDLSKYGAVRRSVSSLAEVSDGMPCAYIPTQFISINELADIWDKVIFTEYEEIVIKALQILAPECENIAFVKNISSISASARTAKVKMKGAGTALPLNSMGDGMLRILQLILKILPAKEGFLLIDEFENGLHYSVQEQIWSLIFELAVKLNIQVFATTHSWDCVESFAKVANDNKNAEGILFRVGRSVLSSDNGKIIATVFDKDKLTNLTQLDVEVR